MLLSFRTPVALLLAVLALAACTMDGGYTSLRSAPVLNGALQVAIPPGYCLNSAASRHSGDSAVLLMGRCTNKMQQAPALLSIAVGKGGSAGVMTAGGATLARFFASAQGRATLSRDGKAGDIRLIATISQPDAFLLHLKDRAVGEYWRGITGIRGRLITVSAIGTPEVPLPPAESHALLETALQALRQVNKTGG